jgi:hypothetical protein
MFKKEAPIYSAILIIYLVIITILRWQLKFEMFLFWLGGFFGLLLYNLDHVVYLLWQSPEEPTALKFKQLISKRRFNQSLDLLSVTCQERKQLMAHSVIFQGALVVLTFFALSSTASLFGKGMAIGLFLYSLINQGLKLAREEGLGDWFWQLGIRLSSTGEAFYFLSLVVIFFFFSRMLV